MVPVESFRPIQDFVVVKQAPLPEMEGSIHLPQVRTSRDGNRDLAVEGEVVSVGPGRVSKRGVFVPTQVKPGDRVLLPKWHGKEMKALGDDYAVIAEEFLLAVIESEAA